MFKNYFYLFRFVLEEEKLLKNYSIVEIFTQQKDSLILRCENEDDELYIEISVSRLLPFIQIRNNYSRARKNTVNFFQEFLPLQIQSVEIAAFDRTIRITGEDKTFYYFLRGGKSNVILSDNDKNEAFLKTTYEEVTSLVEEFRRTDFQNSFNPELFNFPPSIEISQIRKQYPFISKEITNELSFRLNKELITKEELLSIIKEVVFSKIIVSLNRSDVSLFPIDFKTFPADEAEVFSTYNEAMHFYIKEKYFTDNFYKKQNLLTKHLESEMARTAKRINNCKAVIDSGTKEEEYNKIANLLLINLYNIKKGTDSITLDDIYSDGNQITVKLKNDIDPRGNIDFYYEKSRNEKINYSKSVSLFEDYTKRFQYLKNILKQIETIKEVNELESLMKESKIKTGNEQPDKEDLKSKFKHYVIDGKYNVYVGKDSKSNDLLTVQFAKQNDLWFHARSVSGSHTVLRTENTKEVTPKSVIKKAAAIAAYHSKAKTASVAPVSYTFKKYVVKKKGMELGKVALMKEEVVLVKPEIPDGCEFITE